MPRPQPRPLVGLMKGYHSPQVSAEVRLNTNEAAEPPPAEFVTAMSEAMADIAWNRYPDRAATDLREAIAAMEGVDPARVFAANGSNEVLQCLALAYGGPDRPVVLFEPTYAMHSQIARVAGSAVIDGGRGPDMRIDLASAGEVLATHRPSITFLCSPNNPTGVCETEDTIRAVLAMVEDTGGLLVVDEAYGQFSTFTSLSLVNDHTPLVVTRTYSKTWSMAAARLGYLVGPTWLVDDMEKVVLPYHLDAMTQAAGTLALRFEPEMRRRVAAIVEQRGRIMAGLAELGVEYWPSEANYVLFRVADDPTAVWQRLLDRSVLVRNCAGWPGADGCLRVTVGTPEENGRFLSALAEAIGGSATL